MMNRKRQHIRSTQGFSLVELLIVMGILSIISTIVVPQLLMAFERSRQRRSMAEMRAIAAANGTYRVDASAYAGAFADLVPDYLGVEPTDDAWGTAWVYAAGGAGYTVTSLGRDAAAGPAPPADWYDEPFEADLILTNGVFTQVPQSR